MISYTVDQVRGTVDFAVITVRTDEYEAVLERFSGHGPIRGGKQLSEYCRLKMRTGSECGVALARLPGQGQTIAQSVARDLIDDLDPKWLILVGIAGGVPDSEFSLGDVVVATEVHDFTVSAKTERNRSSFQQGGGPLRPEARRVVAALPAWRNRLRSWNSEESIGRAKPAMVLTDRSKQTFGSPEWKEKVAKTVAKHFPSGSESRPPLFATAPGASSNTLIKDTGLVTQWLKSARHITHVEMEAGGAYEAAHSQGRILLCVRGISDIVGLRRDDEWTEYACQSVAAFLYELLHSGLVDPEERELHSALGSPHTAETVDSANDGDTIPVIRMKSDGSCENSIDDLAVMIGEINLCKHEARKDPFCIRFAEEDSLVGEERRLAAVVSPGVEIRRELVKLRDRMRILESYRALVESAVELMVLDEHIRLHYPDRMEHASALANCLRLLQYETHNLRKKGHTRIDVFLEDRKTYFWVNLNDQEMKTLLANTDCRDSKMFQLMTPHPAYSLPTSVIRAEALPALVRLAVRWKHRNGEPAVVLPLSFGKWLIGLG